MFETMPPFMNTPRLKFDAVTRDGERMKTLLIQGDNALADFREGRSTEGTKSAEGLANQLERLATTGTFLSSEERQEAQETAAKIRAELAKSGSDQFSRAPLSPTPAVSPASTTAAPASPASPASPPSPELVAKLRRDLVRGDNARLDVAEGRATEAAETARMRANRLDVHASDPRLEPDQREEARALAYAIRAALAEAAQRGSVELGRPQTLSPPVRV